jgi:hypothetical protein
MPDSTVRVVLDERAIRALSSSDEMRDLLLEEAQPIATDAAVRAPKRTGAGAGSIRAESVVDFDEWTARVSWTRAHYYMYFHDRGTKYVQARRFLEEALEGALQ